MECIDFDTPFTLCLNEWVEKNRSKYRRPEEMEDAVPDVYLRFLNTPAAWLDGATPGAYFDRVSDAGELCALLARYVRENVPVPDPLLDRLCDLADEEAILGLVTDRDAPCAARMHAIELLRQLDSAKPMVEYLRWQVERAEDEDLLDNALESLRQMGEQVRKPAKIAFAAAQEAGKEALLDVLCDYPGDEDVFQYALERFRTTKDKRALFAGYLAKLDDDHALEALLDVAEGNDLNYIDFIEIRIAIERLGSEAPIRDFSNDPTYRAMRRLQQ
ncbi:MAG: hypothetical protein RR367_07355 [Clostridia bacterium]